MYVRAYVAARKMARIELFGRPLLLLLLLLLGVVVMASFIRTSHASLPALYATCPGWGRTVTHDLDQAFAQHIFGQPHVTRSVLARLRTHLEDDHYSRGDANSASMHALALALHGTTGVGKTFTSQLISRSLFAFAHHNDGRDVHTFVGSRFMDTTRVQALRQELYETIHDTVRACPRSLFIFQDAHLVADGILDAILPFLEVGASNINGADYTRAIFIFQSNACGTDINAASLRLAQEDATDHELAAVRRVLADCLRTSEQTRISYGRLFKRHAVEIVPFVPLRREHAALVAERELRRQRALGRYLNKWHDLTWSSSFVEEIVLQDVEVTPEGYLRYGCKEIAAAVVRALGDTIPDMHDMDTSCWFVRCYTHWAHDLALDVKKVLTTFTGARSGDDTAASIDDDDDRAANADGDWLSAPTVMEVAPTLKRSRKLAVLEWGVPSPSLTWGYDPLPRFEKRSRDEARTHPAEDEDDGDSEQNDPPMTLREYLGFDALLRSIRSLFATVLK